jgi:TatA/E family protein of Tat protein translocase
VSQGGDRCADAWIDARECESSPCAGVVRLRDHVRAGPGRVLPCHPARVPAGELMGAIEPWHLIVILAVVLIVLGPKRLPEVGRSLGETIREFRKSTSESPEATPPGTGAAPTPAAAPAPAAPPPSPIALAAPAPAVAPIGPPPPVATFATAAAWTPVPPPPAAPSVAPVPPGAEPAASVPTEGAPGAH